MSFLTNFLKLNQSKWMPFMSMLVALYCILVLDYDFQQIIVFFVAEIFLVMVFAIIRMLWSYDDLPPIERATEKIIWLILGILGIAFFMTLSFSTLSKSLKQESFVDEVAFVLPQVAFLFVGQIEAIHTNFFKNNYYKSASPRNQMGSFFYVLTIIAFLQLFTIYLLPNYPFLNQAKMGVVALIVVKFCIDYLSNFVQYGHSK